MTAELGVAISTDGVGTKNLIAQALEKYDTIGIDCVAMNVNDIICVGATPVSMVDYVAIERAEERFLRELGAGLARGAEEAGISIPGGELAQVREIIQPAEKGIAFDLVGTAIGVLRLDDMVLGRDVAPGDRILGFASSGVHSNGFTLARKVLADLGEHVSALGATVGEELLRPTTIYVKLAERMKAAGIKGKALAHITGDGFFNLSRIDNDRVSFVIESLPETPPIFRLIKSRGEISDEDMYRTFNMGIGFIAVVAVGDRDAVASVAAATGYAMHDLGYVSDEPGKKLHLRPVGLEGDPAAGRFNKVS